MKYILLVLILSSYTTFANKAPVSELSRLPYTIVPGKTKLTKINKHGECIEKGVAFGYYVTCSKFLLKDKNLVDLDDEETVNRLHLKHIPKNWSKLGFSKKMSFRLFKDLLAKHHVVEYDVTTNDTFYIVKFKLNDLNYELIFNRQTYYSTGTIMFPEGLHEIYIEYKAKLDLDF
ncbi:MAG: hypothetical protein KC646_04605 [Candidatus Cloacimonetes bacterium]|nr:hypothetical protein [Candidatus Cloacimonadota bacterium]